MGKTIVTDTSLTAALKRFWIHVHHAIHGTEEEIAELKEDVSAKQDTLVSGTTIKTVNGESLLGSGDVTIASGDTNVLEGVQLNGTDLTITDKKVNVDISGKQDKLTYTEISTATTTGMALAWNTLYQWTVNPTSITISTTPTPTDGRAEIVLRFETGSTAPTLSFPVGWKWANGEIMTAEANTWYELNISTDMKSSIRTVVWTSFKAAS